MSEIELPNLDWISIERVVEIAKKRFAGSLKRIRGDIAIASRVDPTLSLFRAGFTGQTLVIDDDTDFLVSITKTMQNAIGLFHQDVLGEVVGWKSTGAAGGAIDLHGVSPLTEGSILAEVKMRWNTIKASDEAGVWDDLKHAATIAGKGSNAYVFQIVPQTNDPYDRPWKVSGRVPIERVRCADGVTAYHLVTGKPTALFELLEALPAVITRVLDDLFHDGTNAKIAFDGREAITREVISSNLPSRSFYANAR